MRLILRILVLSCKGILRMILRYQMILVMKGTDQIS